MRKHKGLLRVDLRSNAEGLSGVLQMMPKGPANSALKPDDTQESQVSITGLLDDSQTLSAARQGQGQGQFLESQGLHGSMISHERSASAEGWTDRQTGSASGDIRNRHADKLQGEGSEKAAAVATSRKGLVPKFTADSQHVSQQSDKENRGTRNLQGVSSKDGKAAGAKACARPASAKAKSQVRAKHVRQPSTARAACTHFEFEAVSRLQSQPTAHLAQFAAAAATGRPDLQQDGNFATASFSACYEAGDVQVCGRLLENTAVGSASFDGWAKPEDHEMQPAQGSESRVDASFASGQFEQPSTARTARKSVSFQDRHLSMASDHRTAQQHTEAAMAGDAEADSAGDAAYLHGMSRVWREVKEAEEAGRQRAAAESAILGYSVDGFAPVSAGNDSVAADAATHSAAASAAPARQQQYSRSRPGTARPMLDQGHKAVPRQAVLSDQAMPTFGGGRPQDAESGACDSGAQGRAAAGTEADDISRLSNQALSAAAAAMEAAKLNVWKAEVMCEIQGLKSSLQGAAAERHRSASFVSINSLLPPNPQSKISIAHSQTLCCWKV